MYGQEGFPLSCLLRAVQQRRRQRNGKSIKCSGCPLMPSIISKSRRRCLERISASRAESSCPEASSKHCMLVGVKSRPSASGWGLQSNSRIPSGWDMNRRHAKEDFEKPKRTKSCGFSPSLLAGGSRGTCSLEHPERARCCHFGCGDSGDATTGTWLLHRQQSRRFVPDFGLQWKIMSEATQAKHHWASPSIISDSQKCIGMRNR